MNNQNINLPEVFTPEERNENAERKRELIKLVVSGEAVLMVGSGSSARLKYVTWDGLLEKLEELAIQCGDGLDQSRKKDLLVYAEDIKSHINEKTGSLKRYHDCLYDLFKRKSPPCEPCDDFHKMLVSLPFRGILTTNYDTVLEAALGVIDPGPASDNFLVIDESSAARVHEFLMSMNNDRRMTKRIAHLHGKFDPAASIILTIEDYRRAYGLNLTDEESHQQNESKLRFRLLWAVLATRRVVFVGFSMEDPYLNKILEVVTEDLWTWNKSTHFAIMSISSKDAENSKDKAKMLDREYGVSTVFYEDTDGLHKGLEKIIEEINEVFENSSQSTTDQEDWLEQVNQNMEKGIGNEN
jgi:hypothetical protein